MRAQATVLACSAPAEVEVPVARWSCAELADCLVTMGQVTSVAVSTVWRWLQAERLKPWRFHYWQKVIDPNFVSLASAVLALYEQAADLLKQGIWVVCADEKTSIQARRGWHAPVPAVPEHSVHVTPRYQRQGAGQLFAALSVADGRVSGCIRRRKCFVDFQAFILEVLVPDAIERQVREVRLILDNGPTHPPKQLRAWLAQQQAIHHWPLSIQVLWLPKYASWLDQIEIWFSILQRKVLTSNHAEDLGALPHRILEFIDHYNQNDINEVSESERQPDRKSIPWLPAQYASEHATLTKSLP